MRQTDGGKLPLIVLLGPTAVGKTALSVGLAAALGGEIISADSMQFYRYMDIGTAKIRPNEMRAVDGQIIPHHLLDIADPDQPYTVADFQRDAAECIRDITARGRLPLLVGGSMLYIQALTDGYTFGEDAGGNEVLRARLQQEYDTLGGNALHRRLAAIAPDTALRIAPQDARRLIRALEVIELTGQPPAAQPAAEAPYDVLLLGLHREREQLYRRIEQRVDIMLADGLQAETERLLDMGFGAELKPIQGLGYRQMCQYLYGELTYDEMVRLIKRDTRRFAKRQLTWWRRDGRIRWFDAGAAAGEELLAGVLAAVHGHFGDL